VDTERLINIVGLLTALTCSILLYRGYRRTKASLLGWGAICFLALSIESMILFVDRFVILDVELIAFRHATAIFGVACLAFGLIWDSR
jgi:hypothetical protein